MDFSRWLDSINDIVVPHIFRGLDKLYNDVRRITERVKTKTGKTLMAFQLALERIKDLPKGLIEDDYRVLLNSLRNVDCDEQWFNDLLTKAFVSYAREALRSEGIDIKLSRDHIEVPEGLDFIHKTYVNAARTFWMTPQLFYHNQNSLSKQENNAKIMDSIRNAILKTIRDNVGLDKIFKAYQRDKAPKVEPRKLNITDHFKTIVTKSLLDDDSGEESGDESEFENLELTAKNINKLERTLKKNAHPVDKVVDKIISGDNDDEDETNYDSDTEGIQGLPKAQPTQTAPASVPIRTQPEERPHKKVTTDTVSLPSMSSLPTLNSRINRPPIQAASQMQESVDLSSDDEIMLKPRDKKPKPIASVVPTATVKNIKITVPTAKLASITDVVQSDRSGGSDDGDDDGSDDANDGSEANDGGDEPISGDTRFNVIIKRTEPPLKLDAETQGGDDDLEELLEFLRTKKDQSLSAEVEI